VVLDTREALGLLSGGLLSLAGGLREWLVESLAALVQVRFSVVWCVCVWGGGVGREGGGTGMWGLLGEWAGEMQEAQEQQQRKANRQRRAGGRGEGTGAGMCGLLDEWCVCGGEGGRGAEGGGGEHSRILFSCQHVSMVPVTAPTLAQAIMAAPSALPLAPTILPLVLASHHLQPPPPSSLPHSPLAPTPTPAPPLLSPLPNTHKHTHTHTHLKAIVLVEAPRHVMDRHQPILGGRQQLAGGLMVQHLVTHPPAGGAGRQQKGQAAGGAGSKSSIGMMEVCCGAISTREL
jgi:hypothetical protein